MIDANKHENTWTTIFRQSDNYGISLIQISWHYARSKNPRIGGLHINDQMLFPCLLFLIFIWKQGTSATHEHETWNTYIVQTSVSFKMQMTLEHSIVGSNLVLLGINKKCEYAQLGGDKVN